MWLRPVLISVVAATLLGCAALGAPQGSGAQPSPYPPSVYSHRAGTSEVVLYWDCSRPASGLLRVGGIAHSPYFSDVRALEFDLVGVNEHDRIVSETSGAARDFTLGLNQLSPFELELRLAGTEVRFDLFYRYRSRENLRTVASGPPRIPRRFAQATIQFLVRDACSETQHRISKPTR